MPKVLSLLLCLFVGVGSTQSSTSNIILTDPILQIGLEESGVFFSRIRDWESDSEGYLYILDRDNTVHVFERTGEHRAQIGRNGAGPGEFLNAVSIEVANSHVYVLDANLNRISEFSREGLFITSTNLDKHIMEFVAWGDTLYAIQNLSSSLIVKAALSDLSLWQTHLRSDEIAYFETIEHDFLKTAYQIGVIGNELFVTLPGVIRILFVNRSGISRIIEPQSRMIDAFVEHFIETVEDWRHPTTTRTVVPATIRHTHAWRNDQVLMEAWVLDEDPEFQSVALILDPYSGQETGVRLMSRDLQLTSIKLISPDLIGAVNHDSMTLDVFRIRR